MIREYTGQEYPLQSIYGIGRNYREHAKELANSVPSEPIVFLKSRASLTYGPELILPKGREIHFETELVLWIRDKKPYGCAVGLDLTDRSLQNTLKAQGLPWDLAKSFPGSSVLTPFFPFKTHGQLDFALEINGKERQRGNAKDMIFGVHALLDFLAVHIPLCDDDILFTGTPAGVGPLASGDELKLFLGKEQVVLWVS